MAITCGIVGLPNVGKSTLFNALTRAEVAAENYPFCTIDPNIGIATVPDPRLDRIARIVKPAAIVPTTVQFTDIAGLVAGASKGEGLGNQFLHHIRETDAIAHVVRCFEDPNVASVTGEVDPISSIDTVNTELALADLDTVARVIERTQRRARAGDKEAVAAMSFLERVDGHLATGAPARTLAIEAEDRPRMRDLFLLTAKPMMYVANVGEEDIDAGVPGVAQRAVEDGADLVVFSGAIEAELALLDPDDRADLLAEYGLAEPGLDRVIRAAYHLLGLLTFFTAGPKEARAWTVRKGATAPQAAGQIHTDFERGFIRAEVVSYEDFVAHGGEPGAREAGRWRLEGRDYVVREGDVIFFRFNV